MRRILALGLLVVSAMGLALKPSVTASSSVSPFPQGVVVERVPEPQGLVTVYSYSRPDLEAIFRYYDEDLRRRGWVPVKYEVEINEWEAEYRKGNAKVKLSVKNKKGRVEVRLKEGYYWHY